MVYYHNKRPTLRHSAFIRLSRIYEYRWIRSL